MPVKSKPFILKSKQIRPRHNWTVAQPLFDDDVLMPPAVDVSLANANRAFSICHLITTNRQLN
jgi:hypothetical protein